MHQAIPETVPATAPAATPAAAAPAATATTQTPVAAQPAPGSVVGDFTNNAVSDADDAMLQHMVALGYGNDLGLSSETPATAPAVTAQPQPAAPANPGAETPQQKRDRLARELAEAENALVPKAPHEGAQPASAAAPVASPTVFTPTPDNPLVNLRTAEDFTLTENAARKLNEWAITHRTEGGTLPLEVAQLIENAEAKRTGRAPEKITAAPTIDADGIADIELATSQMLTQHLPKRREVLGEQTGYLNFIRKDSPQFLDPNTEEGAIYLQVGQRYPQLSHLPEWPMLARDLATGFLANRPKPVQTPAPAGAAPAATPVTPAPAAAPAVPTAPDANGKPVPIAPGAAIGGTAPSGPPISQRAIDDAEARLNAGTATDADMLILSHAAV